MITKGDKRLESVMVVVDEMLIQIAGAEEKRCAYLLVAEGNIDNKNQSGVIRRSRHDKILGFIRIDNEYQYKFTGKYDPKLDCF